MADQELEGEHEQVSKVVFSRYNCRSITFPCMPHPGDVAEATSLSSVRLPVSTYPLLEAFPPELVATGKLSNLQLEGVLACANMHQQRLPNGQRAGFFIGDGAGVGKGRQIAGVILDNYVRGRKKALWVSISSDLRIDAQRDLNDLGAHIQVINNVQTLDKETRALGLSQEYQTGVLFMTYSSLIASHGGKSRLQQVIEWLGGEAFDGCLVFDESHKAKNFVAGKEGQSTKTSTKVLELQDRLPNARVLYCSATGVSEVGHMAYMSRMGLWGQGTAFKDFDAFLDTMKRRGVSFLEMLAMEMKAEGKYVARGLSFQDAEFSELDARLTPEQVDVYNSSVGLWCALREGLTSAINLTGTPGKDLWKLYWSAQQRFFKLLCVGLKVPTVVAEATAALEAGCAVIIGLQTTGEAADASMGLEPGPTAGFVSTTKELLLRFIKDHFPIHRFIPPEGPGGASGPSAPKASGSTAGAAREEQGPVVGECKAVRAALLQQVAALQLPGNFLDLIIDSLGGPSQVAEMTGRKGRVVRQGRGNNFLYELRAKPDTADMDSLNIREKDMFMSGKRHVAIISDAASTGISLHAARSTINQRRRVHLTIELPWSADKAIQQLGRSHRANQVSGPIYKLISTNVGGEKRFAAAVARRLQCLGALTRGDRRAASGIDLSQQNFDSPLGRRSLRRMYDAIVTEATSLPPGVSLAAVLKDKIKEQSGRPDMPDDEAEALADIQDPVLRAKTIASLHSKLLEHIDVMGVGVQSSGLHSAHDTTAEDTSSAAAWGGMLASSNNAAGSDKASGKDVGDVKRFLNRLLGLPLADQNLLFTYFTATLAAEVEATKKEGRYSEGLADLPSHRLTSGSPPTVLWQDPLSGLKTLQHNFTLDRGISYQEALSVLNHELAGDAEGGEDQGVGFHRSRRPLYGQHMYLLSVKKPGMRNQFSVIRPNTGRSFLDIERTELEQRYAYVRPEDAQAGWQGAHEAALHSCIHGRGCAQGASCVAGRRLTSVTVLSGSIVRVWGVLEQVLTRHEAQLSRADRIMRVVRVELPSTSQQEDSPSSKATTPAVPGSQKQASRAAADGDDSDSDLEIISEGSQGKSEVPAPLISPQAGDRCAGGSNGVIASTPGAGGESQAADAAPSATISPSEQQQQLPSSADHIVGVRYPAALLPEVSALLQAVHMLNQAKQGGAGTGAGGSGSLVDTLPSLPDQVAVSSRNQEEPPTPVDKRLLTKVFTAPKSIADYFKQKPAAGSGSGSGGPPGRLTSTTQTPPTKAHPTSTPVAAAGSSAGPRTMLPPAAVKPASQTVVQSSQQVVVKPAQQAVGGGKRPSGSLSSQSLSGPSASRKKGKEAAAAGGAKTQSITNWFEKQPACRPAKAGSSPAAGGGGLAGQAGKAVQVIVLDSDDSRDAFMAVTAGAARAGKQASGAPRNSCALPDEESHLGDDVQGDDQPVQGDSPPCSDARHRAAEDDAGADAMQVDGEVAGVGRQSKLRSGDGSKLSQLMRMGFPESLAVAALQQGAGQVDKAVEICLARMQKQHA